MTRLHSFSLTCILTLLGVGAGCDPAPTHSAQRVKPNSTVTSEPEKAVKKIFVQGSTYLPDEGVDDWLSYGDQVSLVTVESEQEVPPPKRMRELGFSYIGRNVTVRIDENLWVREGKAPEASKLKLSVLGWIVQEQGRAIAAAEGAPRVEVGAQYIVALVKMSTGWSLLSPHSVVASLDSEVARKDAEQSGQKGAARSLAGKSNAVIRNLLASTPRDPAVEPFRNLPPEERVRAVLGLKMSEAEPPPLVTLETLPKRGARSAQSEPISFSQLGR